ncbi:MAG: 6-phosphofructokinase [Bacilli bacterium]
MSIKIGILTSGGDSPGMNAAIRAITYAAINKGFEVFAIYDGYKGLLDKNIKQLNKEIVDEISSRGGTIIRTARLPEFKKLEVRQQAALNLKELGINALVVIGGDGSYRGALGLSDLGICCVAIPGTIDNDIASSDFTIGFDTSLNTIVNAIDQIKDTGRSHSRCMVVEVMGNECDDLSIYSSIAEGADVLISRNHMLSSSEVCKILKSKKENGQNFALVIVSEKLIDVNALITDITNNTGWDTRLTVLGHIQRGGTPTAMERVNATRMGYYAVNLINDGITGVCVGLKDNKIVHRNITEALSFKNESSKELLDIVDHIN